MVVGIVDNDSIRRIWRTWTYQRNVEVRNRDNIRSANTGWIFLLGCMKSFFEIFFMHHYLTASLSGKCRFKKTGQYFVRSCVIFLRHIYYLYTPHYFVLVHEAVQYFYHNGPRTLLQLRPLIVLIHQWSYISCLHAVAFATYILWNKQNIIFL